NPLIFISLLLVYFVYYKGLRAEENKFSRSIFKNDYEKYKESTGAILPRPKLLLKFLSFLLLTWK
ncbi:MAG: hypothetical protein KDD50_01115, partial [Bdellovibrionales bacterium]|nr:hypothetical protein [Bdellovibrionales bacterium]